MDLGETVLGQDLTEKLAYNHPPRVDAETRVQRDLQRINTTKLAGISVGGNWEPRTRSISRVFSGPSNVLGTEHAAEQAGPKQRSQPPEKDSDLMREALAISAAAKTLASCVEVTVLRSIAAARAGTAT